MTSGSNRQVMATIQASVLIAIVFILAGATNASTTLTFQQGDAAGYTGAQDTYIAGGGSGSDPNGNNGTSTVLPIFERETNTSNFFRDLFKFDLSSISPSTVIGSATLTLTVDVSLGTANVLNSLYVIDPPDVAWTGATATWNSATTGQPWTGNPTPPGTTGGLIAGTDYNATPTATATTPRTTGAQMTLMLDAAGVAAINDWIQNPSDNTGFFMRQPDGSFSIDEFYSSEFATLADRPELTLVTTPEPASLALLVVGGITLLRRRRA